MLLGRKVELEWQKRRRIRRGQLYVLVPWQTFVSGMEALKAERACRLWLLLNMQAYMEKPEDGWFRPRRMLLREAGLDDTNYARGLAKLEKVGLIEVQREKGKRALVRLIPPTKAPVSA